MPRPRSLACGLIAVAGALLASGATAASLQGVGLRPSDVPSGYKQVLSISMDNKTQAGFIHLKATALTKQGRTAGFMREYLRRNPTIVEVTSLVTQYKTAGGARWEYLQNRTLYLKKAKPVTAPRFGAESYAFLERTGQGKLTDDIYGVAFQNHAYDVAVTILGPTGKVSLSEALHYAGIVAKRT